jgi:predicted PP-loop superfamily ATPase
VKELRCIMTGDICSLEFWDKGGECNCGPCHRFVVDQLMDIRKLPAASVCNCGDHCQMEGAICAVCADELIRLVEMLT